MIIYKIIYSGFLNRAKELQMIENKGALGRTRTCDPLLRRQIRQITGNENSHALSNLQPNPTDFKVD